MTDAIIMDEGPHPEVIKMLTTLKCILCGKVFGPMTYRVASETLTICPKCKATRKKVKRGK